MITKLAALIITFSMILNSVTAFASNSKEVRLVSETSFASDEYIFANSDKEYLTDEQINSLDSATARLAINEIAARHGRIFKDAELNNYFMSKSWYTPTLTKAEYDKVVNEILNIYEEVNSRRLLARKEGRTVPSVNEVLGEMQGEARAVAIEARDAYLNEHNIQSYNNSSIGTTQYLDGLAITLQSVELSYGNYTYLGGLDYWYWKPDPGKVFVICHFNIVNISDSNKYVSSYDFNAYADNYAVEKVYVPMYEFFDNLSANLSPGKMTKGDVCFECPDNFNHLEINARSWGKETWFNIYRDSLK